MLKYSVGYQILRDNMFIDEIINCKDYIEEVYFSWGDFPNGRNLQTQQTITPWEATEKQISDLKNLNENGISFNLLFNGNCYGKDSLSRHLFNKIGDTVDYRNTGARGVVSDMDGSPGNTLSPEEQIEINENAKTSTAHHRSVQFTRPTREGSVAPDLQFQFRIAAVACGLGEIGWSKMLLTPEFGPLQRVAFIFTDAELEYDEMYSGKPLCRRCGACVRECSGGCIPAINSGKTVTVNLDGKILEWGDIDMWRCYAFYTHAGRYYNPFVPKEVWDKNENGALDLMEGVTDVANEHEIMKVYTALQKYFPSWVGYNMAKCGGCIRACVSILEKKGGCMENRLKKPLRTKKAWRLDR